MHRFQTLKRSPSLIYVSIFHYESMWSRLIKYFKKPNVTSDNAYHEDMKNLSSLSEQVPYQYKVDETRPKDFEPGMILEAQLRMMEDQKEISDIERVRMKQIDKIVGTSTHFHEVQPNEERLSSEFVMERQALKTYSEKDNYLDNMVNLDPQQRIIPPKIRNYHEFSKQAFERRSFPKHLKENTVISNKHESLLDSYKYLEFNANAEMFDKKISYINSNQDFKKYMDFLGQELLYTTYSLAKMLKTEERISKEYFALMKTFNVQPLNYDGWIYYTKDPLLTSKSLFDIYRVRVKKNTQDQDLIKVTDINPQEEECVLTAEEIIEFLKSNFIDNEDVNKFIQSIRNHREISIYKELCFDKEHKIMGIILNTQIPLIIFKNIMKNAFSKSLLIGVDEVMIDQDNGVYFIRSNDLERKCFLMYHRINDIKNNVINEICLYEESDPNYQLKVQQCSNYDIGLLICSKIAGNPTNEIGLIDLRNKITKIQRTFDRKQGIFWIMKLNDEAYYFMEKAKNKIYRIFRSPEAQSLSLINQNLSKELYLNNTTPVRNNTPTQTDILNKLSTIERNSLAQISEEKYLVESFQKTENYEVFYEAVEGEELKNFEVFKHYVIIELISDRKEFFKVYNCKNRSFHTMLIPEPLFEIKRSFIQHYDSQFFLFNMSTPHLPTKLMSYNMALREFTLLFSETYPGLNLTNYTLERVEAVARDGVKIPVSFIYNKYKVNENSVVILHGEYYSDKAMKREFKPEIIGFLDRGFIYAFPHVRGSFDINQKWFEQGSGLKKLTMITDYIDTAAFIIKNDIAKRIFALGVNYLGGLCAIISVLREPKVFSACIIDNGIFDILEFLERHPNKEEAYKWFGDHEDRIIYDFIKSYNPYTLKKIALRNTLITADSKDVWSGSARKFIAKVRENEANTNVYYKEFSFKDLQQEKSFFQTAFFTELAFNQK